MKDPLLRHGYSNNDRNSISDVDIKIAELLAKREQLNNVPQNNNQTPICDKIDAELSSLTELQLDKLNSMNEFNEIQNRLNDVTNFHLMGIIKPLVERDHNGKQILDEKLKFIQNIKKDLVNDVKKDMDIVELMKQNPTLNYEQIVELHKSK